MTLQSSGVIGLADVNGEMGLSTTTQISMDDSGPRFIASQSLPTTSNIYDDWYRFSHDSSENQPANASEINAWYYNPVTNSVSTTVNSSTVIGFVSDVSYDAYTHVVRLRSLDSDDDAIGVVIAWYVDQSTGREYTLSAVRSLGGVGLTWQIIYNYGRSDQAVIADGNAAVMWGNGGYGATAGAAGYVANSGYYWGTSYPAGAYVRIERVGNNVVCKTSQLLTSVPANPTYDANATLSIDLSANPLLYKFMGSSPYGYLAWSQNQSYHEIISFTRELNVLHMSDYYGGNWYDLYISPAINSISYWRFGTHGPLAIATPGEYYITPGRTINVNVGLGGAGGGAGGYDANANYAGNGGGGCYVKATGSLMRDVTYRIRVGGGGGGGASGTQGGGGAGGYNGGGTGGGAGYSGSSGAGGGGGGATGLYNDSLSVIVMAGGGGGGGGDGKSGSNGNNAGNNNYSSISGSTYTFVGTNFTGQNGRTPSGDGAGTGAGGGGYYGGAADQSDTYWENNGCGGHWGSNIVNSPFTTLINAEPAISQQYTSGYSDPYYSYVPANNYGYGGSATGGSGKSGYFVMVRI